MSYLVAKIMWGFQNFRKKKKRGFYGLLGVV